MSLVTRGYKTLVQYPDGASKVVTLYVRPARGQIIAHGWKVTSVVPGWDDGSGAPIAYQILVTRQADRVSG